MPEYPLTRADRRSAISRQIEDCKTWAHKHGAVS